MTETSITHPNDTPISRINILQMKAGELRDYISKIQEARQSVFNKIKATKERISKAKQDDTCNKIELAVKRAQSKLEKADKLIIDASDYLTKVRALELELEDQEVEDGSTKND